MRLGRLLFFGWCFGSIAGGCTSDLELQLEGLRCNGQNRCSKGYACNKYTRECVRNDAGPPAEGGSSAGGVGNPTGGASSWHGGAGGNGGVAGTSDIGGQGGVDSGGAGGSEDDFDAGPPELVDGGPDGCVPTTLFRDDDRDTYGVVAGPGYGCPQRGWATRAGDCRDDLAIVHPDQDRFFGEGFVDQTKPGNISFDYDCSNLEEPSPNNNDNAVPPDVCPALGLTCQGSGFLAANSPPRTGSGADQRCGSVMRRNCQVEGILGCTAVDTPVADFLRFLCH